MQGLEWRVSKVGGCYNCPLKYGYCQLYPSPRTFVFNYSNGAGYEKTSISVKAGDELASYPMYLNTKTDQGIHETSCSILACMILQSRVLINRVENAY